MTKEYRTVPAEEVFAKLPAARRAKIKERAAELISEELGLQELRKSKQITQEEIAERLGGRQVYISRLEKRDDMKLSTLRAYVEAIGGDLQLMVTFPEGKSVFLKQSPGPTRRRRMTSKPKATGGSKRVEPTVK
jgi:uncharacterized protein YnzC (UPF0291/DUF896 family)